jgi:hypothetical protein
MDAATMANLHAFALDLYQERAAIREFLSG